MADIILERQFTPTLSPESFREMALESVDCLNLYRVEWKESLLAEDGSRLLCRFKAPDSLPTSPNTVAFNFGEPTLETPTCRAALPKRYASQLVQSLES